MKIFPFDYTGWLHEIMSTDLSFYILLYVIVNILFYPEFLQGHQTPHSDTDKAVFRIMRNSNSVLRDKSPCCNSQATNFLPASAAEVLILIVQVLHNRSLFQLGDLYQLGCHQIQDSSTWPSSNQLDWRYILSSDIIIPSLYFLQHHGRSRVDSCLLLSPLTDCKV